uniref:GAG-pre-integrase domain-containing protein n=1 Tax=Brassica oleracea var. oleracea TaxID=109376 RepID=A0A0D3E6W1_BRAOL
MSDGRVWKITKVRHVPKLMRNLISVGQLNDTGHDVNFGGGAWRVKKGSMMVARGHKRGTLYMTTSYQDTVVVVENAKQTKLWHCRLGHMSEKGMKLMVENGALPDLKTVDHQMCESCILGKQKRVTLTSRRAQPGMSTPLVVLSALEDEMLVLEKILGSKNPADMLTKVVSYDKLRLCATSVGLLE